MKRLTKKHYGKDEYFMKCSENCFTDYDEEPCELCQNFDAVVNLLGAYEDTGFTPEEVVQMAEELRKLKENARVVPVIRMREET